MLAATRSVQMGFRILDLDTLLRGLAARDIGATWADLFDHVLSRGVDITLILANFDPILATEYHRKRRQSVERLAAVQGRPGGGG